MFLLKLKISTTQIHFATGAMCRKSLTHCHVVDDWMGGFELHLALSHIEHASPCFLQHADSCNANWPIFIIHNVDYVPESLQPVMDSPGIYIYHLFFHSPLVTHIHRQFSFKGFHNKICGFVCSRDVVPAHKMSLTSILCEWREGHKTLQLRSQIVPLSLKLPPWSPGVTVGHIIEGGSVL